MSFGRIKLLPVHQLKIKYLYWMAGYLSEWEHKFISTARIAKAMTTAQLVKLEEIYTKIRHGKYNGVSVTESWDEVHNFDRN